MASDWNAANEEEAAAKQARRARDPDASS